MNRRNLLGGLLVSALAIGCGGRMSPVTFAPDNMELAKSLSKSIEKKDMEGIRRIQRAAENREKMANDEKEAFKWIVSACEKGEWDSAKAYVDKCIASGK